MKTKEAPEIIGQRVEYQASGQLYRGMVIDKVRIIGRYEDAGREFDLYVIKAETGRVFKISPAQVTRILEAEI